MKVFITGATGFIGSFLAESLIQNKNEVRCLVRRKSNLRWIADLDIDCFYGNLMDKDSLIRGIDGCDVIFHLAGVTKARTEEEYYVGNYEGTKNIIDAAIKHRKKISRLIFISSQTAVGPSPTIIPIDENHPPNPITDYGRSKLAAEEYARSVMNKLPITIIRPPAVYGPRDSDILEFFRTVNLGLIPQLGRKAKYMSLIHVKDLIRGIIIACESEKAIGQTYFISNPKPYAQEDLSRLILKVLQKRGIKLKVPVNLMRGIATVLEGLSSLTKKPALVNKQKVLDMEQEFWTCSSVKARKELGFEAEIGVENGIRETIIWYKEQKWL